MLTILGLALPGSVQGVSSIIVRQLLLHSCTLSPASVTRLAARELPAAADVQSAACHQSCSQQRSTLCSSRSSNSSSSSSSREHLGVSLCQPWSCAPRGWDPTNLLTCRQLSSRPFSSSSNRPADIGSSSRSEVPYSSAAYQVAPELPARRRRRVPLPLSTSAPQPTAAAACAPSEPAAAADPAVDPSEWLPPAAAAAAAVPEVAADADIVDLPPSIVRTTHPAHPTARRSSRAGQQQLTEQPPPPPPTAAAEAGRQGRQTKGPDRGANGNSAGLGLLQGTEEQLFSQALAWVPPQAAAQLAEVAELAARHRQDGSCAPQLPAHQMLHTISRVLDLSRQFPDLDPAPLLHPIIALARTQYSLESLLPRIRRMRRLLPDAKLRAALLSRDPADVSRTISRAVKTFLTVLAMQPPVQLLSAPRAFVRALTLPQPRLAQHLALLRKAVSSLPCAQQLAQRYTGALLGPSAEVLLQHVGAVARLLDLTQDAAAELLLRHPHLASTRQQLAHLSSFVDDLPKATGIDRAQLQQVLAKRPSLLRYGSPAALAGKVQALRPLFPGAAVQELLEVCCYSKVQHSTDISSVAASLRTCAAVMGYDSIAPLLPLLLQLSTPAQDPTHESQVAETPKKPHSYLLQPMDKLAARAVQLQKLYGLSREQLAQLARRYPRLVFGHSHATTKLKALLLQLQLLGDGSHVAEGQLAPEVERIFQACPQLSSLKHQTAVDRLANMQQLLQLEPREVAGLVLRLPSLLVYAPGRLAGLYQGLQQLLGGDAAQQHTRQLVQQWPQVLPLFARLQAADGQLPVVLMLQELVKQPASQPQPLLLTQPDLAMAQDSMHAAVRMAAATAAGAQQQGQAAGGSSFRGVRGRAPHSWEMRHAGRSIYFPTQLDAACAYDLALLAAGGRPRAGGGFNFPANTYSSDQVQGMAEYLQALMQQKQEKQQRQHEEAGQQQSPEVVLPPAGAEPPRAAADAISAQHSGSISSSIWGLVKQLLLSAGGRQLLGMSPDAASSRLQALSVLTGLSQQQLLQQLLQEGPSSRYPDAVLRCSPARLDANASALQQLLQLSHADLQRLLRRAPSLLAYRKDSMAEKVAALLPAFQSCCAAAGFSLVAAVAAGSSGGSGVWGQHSTTGREGLVCLQQAVLHTPGVLLLSEAKVLQRAALLQELFEDGQHGAAALAEQLRAALGSGRIGRWLTAGDAHYDKLRQLACAGSPVLQQLRLAHFFRMPRNALGGVDCLTDA